jgi:protein TonB
MFTPLQSGLRPCRFAAFGSVILHGLFLLWFLHTPESRTVFSSAFVVRGDHGAQIAHLYGPNRQSWVASDALSLNSAASQLNSHLTWQKHVKQKQTKRELPRPQLGRDAETASRGQVAPAHAAGSPLGTVLEGWLTGEEVRPALPIVSPDPRVDADELNGLRGDVVVEVTIDQQGNIVQKVVIQSLAPAIDDKVLEALANWRFRPATRNGVAIASKQDVFYHFPRFGKG